MQTFYYMEKDARRGHSIEYHPYYVAIHSFGGLPSQIFIEQKLAFHPPQSSSSLAVLTGFFGGQIKDPMAQASADYQVTMIYNATIL